MVASGDLRLLVLPNKERSKNGPTSNACRWLRVGVQRAVRPGWAKGMDPAVVKKLHDAFKKAYDDAKVIELIERFDVSRLYLSAEDYAKEIPKRYDDERQNLERVGPIKK